MCHLVTTNVIAGIVAVCGAVTPLDSPPESLGFKQLESDSEIFVFKERDNFELPTSLYGEIGNSTGMYFEDSYPW